VGAEEREEAARGTLRAEASTRQFSRGLNIREVKLGFFLFFFFLFFSFFFFFLLSKLPCQGSQDGGRKGRKGEEKGRRSSDSGRRMIVGCAVCYEAAFDVRWRLESWGSFPDGPGGGGGVFR